MSLSTDPTYKEWKLSCASLPHCLVSAKHGSYLQGMETDKFWKGLAAYLGTDPTYKEWKRNTGCILGGNRGSTDPTYKEWKLSIGLGIFGQLSSARILPTRNGNLMIPVKLSFICRHGSYLQGMETLLNSVWRAVLTAARILPTRNGNWDQGMIAEAEAEHGSYLQGMETLRMLIDKQTFNKSTDPTYKEWKPGQLEFTLVISSLGTDPTYKEWKPVCKGHKRLRVCAHGSYLQGMETPELDATELQKLRYCTDPTYKEWKLFMSL